MKRYARTICTVGLLLVWSAHLEAQDANREAAAPGRLSKVIMWTESTFDGVTTGADGLYPVFGGLISGSGPSAGPGYRPHLPEGGNVGGPPRSGHPPLKAA